MPAILTSNISAISAAQFVNNIVNDESNIYIAVGGDASHPWDNENVPPIPVDSIKDEKTFRENLIGIKRVNVANVMLMAPRIEWAPGMTFNVLSETNPAPRKATDYYCLTSNNFVYQCIGKRDDNIITTIGSEPDLKIDSMETADGYTWKFLYNITTKMVNDGMLVDDWMPVPYNKHGVYPGGTITEDQNSYGDVNANWTLGAFRVLITIELSDEGEVIPYDIEFRQVGLLYDPQDAEGNFIAGSSYAKADFNAQSGRLFYLENKRVIKREEGQTELLHVLLSF